MKIRALIIDDEPHAREGIRLRLKEYPSIIIVGECGSGSEAVKSINTLKPDIVFLDIQMPEMNGFKVIQKITLYPMPVIVFITAYDRYAVKAFEFHALDYLLKPINDDRFKEAVHAAIAEINHRNIELYASKLKLLAKDYLQLLDDEVEEHPSEKPIKGTTFIDRLLIKSKDHILVVAVREIDWIESAGDYVYIHTQGQKHILRETMSDLEQRLDPKKIIRVHRSIMVNVDQIKSLRPNEHGDYDVFLQNGVKLKMSRSYRTAFQNVVGNLF
jgi:two-component system LytT family response regulator